MSKIIEQNFSCWLKIFHWTSFNKYSELFVTSEGLSGVARSGGICWLCIWVCEQEIVLLWSEDVVSLSTSSTNTRITPTTAQCLTDHSHQPVTMYEILFHQLIPTHPFLVLLTVKCEGKGAAKLRQWYFRKCCLYCSTVSYWLWCQPSPTCCWSPLSVDPELCKPPVLSTAQIIDLLVRGRLLSLSERGGGGLLHLMINTTDWGMMSAVQGWIVYSGVIDTVLPCEDNYQAESSPWTSIINNRQLSLALQRSTFWSHIHDHHHIVCCLYILHRN